MKTESNTGIVFNVMIFVKMNRRLFKPFCFLSIGLVLFCPAASLADGSAQLITYHCFSCHTEKLVESDLSLPHTENHLLQILLAFKYDRKSASIMDRITKGYTDDQLKSVAAYLTRKE